MVDMEAAVHLDSGLAKVLYLKVAMLALAHSPLVAYPQKKTQMDTEKENGIHRQVGAAATAAAVAAMAQAS